jgi:hypothetical protein
MDKELLDSIKKLTNEIQINNSLLTKNKDTQLIEHDMTYYIKRFIQEIMEASIGLLFVMITLNKSFSGLEFFKITGTIGFITLILEEYNTSSSNNFKQGIFSNIGSGFFNRL